MVFDRYLGKNLALAGGLIALALAMIIMLTQSLRFLELIISAGASSLSFFILTFLAMPRFLEVILPIALMIGTVFIYNRLHGDSELNALRAAGLSPLRLARPALMMGVVCAVFLFFVSGWFAPMALSKMQSMRVAIKAEYSNLLLRAGVFNTITKDITVFIERRGADGALEGLMIHDSRPSNPAPVTVIAKRGMIVADNAQEQVLVFDGSRQSVDQTTGALSRLDFEKYALDLPSAGPAGQRFQEPDERTLWQLLTPPEEVRKDPKLAREFYVESHRRFISPFLAISFPAVALGFLLLGRFDRQGTGRAVMAATSCVIVLQGLYLMAYNLAIDHTAGLVFMYALIFVPLAGSLFLLSPMGERIRPPPKGVMSPRLGIGGQHG